MVALVIRVGAAPISFPTFSIGPAITAPEITFAV